MPSRWIIPITGFTESAEHQTGIEKIWRQIRDLANHELTIVTPFEWDDKMKGFAKYILRNSESRPEIMVIAYSWGCGVGFIELAQECTDLGIPIKVAVLADPVYRSRWMPKWLALNPLSLTSFPSIKIPPSVEAVEWVRQKISVPSGHNLIAANPLATRIDDAQILQANHQWIDDHPKFVELAVSAARAFAIGASFKEGAL